MSQQHETPVAYPRPTAEFSLPAAPPQPVVAQYEGQNSNYQVPYIAEPPPAGYPTNYGTNHTAHVVPVQTNSKGEGFWKGCVAAICCCWVLDFCCC